MKIIENLIEDLTSNPTIIDSALLKAQVLAYRLNDADLKEWVNNELRGYEKESRVPDYRLLKLTLVGDVSNGYWMHSQRVLPTYHLTDEIRNRLTTHEVRGSISVVIEMANPEKDYGVSIPPEYFHLIGKKFTGGYAVQSARGIYSAGAMTQILTQVKSRLLDFVLTLSEKAEEMTSEEDLKDLSRRINVNEMFKNSIFGNGTTIIIGNNNVQSIDNNIVSNDIESLFRFLRQSNIKEDDISDLGMAISADANDITNTSSPPGIEVSKWIKKMISKAGSAGWQVSTEAAGNLLATAIAAFYGLK